MPYRLYLTPSAKMDLQSFDKSVALEIIKKLEKLEVNPFLGKALGNKMGINLTGFYKLYVYRKKVRIVYSIPYKKEAIEVIAIGKRESEEVYKKIIERIF